MDFQTLKTLEEENVMQTYGRFNLALDHGQGAWLYDLDGKPYLDLTSGIGVNSLGHNHPVLTQAIEQQIHKVIETSNLYYTKPMVLAAKTLCENTGLDKVFFANSGAEANEGMIKIARKYSFEKYGPQRTKILTLVNSFHGRTIATLEATGQDHYHTYYFPFTNGFVYAKANDIEDVRDKLDDSVCAIMFELIQGEGGVLPLDYEFVQQLAKLAEEKDLLLLVDEVQTGAGRTGTLYCYQHYDIQPDVVTSAKGLGGGVPVGAVLADKKVSSVLGKGDHGSTFGANPLAASAVNAVLSCITKPDFLQEVSEKGEYFKNALQDIDHKDIADVRGQGLMIGVEIADGKVSEYIEKLMEKGVLVLKAGTDTIRLLPPLTIEYADLDHAIQVFQEVFA